MNILLGSLFYQQEVEAIFNDTNLLHYMLQAEVALANAQAKVGVISTNVAKAIASVVAEQGVGCLDIPTLATASKSAGNIAIPFVKQLTAAVKRHDETASGYVHWGATSQDIIDTATMLQVKVAITIIETQLQTLYNACLSLAQAHREQVMIGRTWLQQALPITLGHKAARWADALARDIQRLQHIKTHVLTAQLGGAVGTLASLGDKGSEVVTAFAKELGLNAPNCTWHGERDRIVEIGSTLAMIIGTIANMTKDWSLMMQTEIAEVAEPSGKNRGGSSTMPHKRNPVAAASILAAGNRAPVLMASLYHSMIQDHERSLGAWHAEWLVLPELFMLCGGCLERAVDVIQNLQVFPQNMAKNLGCTQGLIMAEAVMMALAPKTGRLNAHHLIEQACQTAVQQSKHLYDVLSADVQVTEHLDKQTLIQLFDPKNYLGNTQAQIDKVLNQ